MYENLLVGAIYQLAGRGSGHSNEIIDGLRYPFVPIEL